MSVFYHVVGRRNRIVLGEVKYYAQVNSSIVQSFEDVCQTIADRWAMTKGNVVSLNDGLIFSIIQAFYKGQPAKMGEFGCFWVVTKGMGAKSPKEFSANMIKKERILFTSDKRLKEVLSVPEAEANDDT